MRTCFSLLCGALVSCATVAAAAPSDYQDIVSNDAPVLSYQFNETTGAALNYGSLGHAYDATSFGQDLERYFTGTLDELALYDRALSAAEVEEHFAPLARVLCSPAPAGMSAWWTGDGDASDSQDGHDGTLHGGLVFAQGEVAQAFSFDGADDFVLIPDSDDFNPTGAFSVDAWIKADPQQSSPDHQFVIIDKSHGFSDGTGWALQGNPDGTMGFFFGKGGGSGDPSNFVGVSTTTSVLDDEWHHIAGVFNGSQFEIYVDGALSNTFAFSGSIVNNTREVEIGRSWGGGAPTRFFHGLIDEVRYFDAALSASDIQAIFDAGSAGNCKPDACAAPRCKDIDEVCKACGQPVGTGAAPTASDALAILRTAIGARQCAVCVCDVDDSGSIVATDALLTLKRAVGQNVTLSCPVG